MLGEKTACFLCSGLLCAAIAAGCNHQKVANDYRAQVKAVDELIAAMKEEEFASRDDYVRRLEMLKSQLLAEKERGEERQMAFERMRTENEGLARELEFLKKHVRVEVASIEIPFYSGGKDTDRDGKDDYIEAAVCPRDADGDILKAIGTCRFELYRRSFIGMGEIGRLLMRWDFSYEQVNDAWVDRLFRGYDFVLRWDGNPPPVEDVVLRAVFTTLDGESHVARKKVKLRL